MTDPGAGSAGLVVRVGESRWVVPFSAVIEVMRDSRIARLPAIPSGAMGVVNHRGRVLTVIDPLRALVLPGEAASLAEVVVVEHAGRRFGVAVDAVVEIAAGSRTGIAELDLEAVVEAVFGEPT